MVEARADVAAALGTDGWKDEALAGDGTDWMVWERSARTAGVCMICIGGGIRADLAAALARSRTTELAVWCCVPHERILRDEGPWTGGLLPVEKMSSVEADSG